MKILRVGGICFNFNFTISLNGIYKKMTKVKSVGNYAAVIIILEFIKIML